MKLEQKFSQQGADFKVDKLYGDLRGRYGSFNARANGYRLQVYFRREQELILDALGDAQGRVLDIACGSGLMALPLASPSRQVIGVDFNTLACNAAQENGLSVFRGDAFCLPLKNSSIDRALSCQFLNQQSAINARGFVAEAFRVLKPSGQLIIVWRNGQALIHKVAHQIFSVTDLIQGQVTFPNVDHSLDQLTAYATETGFTVLDQFVSFPLLRWRSREIGSLTARLIGASNVMVLQKPNPKHGD